MRRKSYRVQKNVTLTDEQLQFVNENINRLTSIKLAEQAGVTYNVLIQNLRILKLGRYNKPAKAVSIEGYFDIETFAKNYYY